MQLMLNGFKKSLVILSEVKAEVDNEYFGKGSG
jgi:hypothetical protein